MKNFYTKFFFKISVHPHIVIANKKFNNDTAVCKFGQLS